MVFVAPATHKILENIHKKPIQGCIQQLLVSDYFLNFFYPEKNPDKDFIGHCCELRGLKNEIRQENFNEPNFEFNMLNYQYSNN